CACVALRVDGELVGDEPIALVAAANGRQFGGGMQIAPEARPDDGWLDVVSVANTTALRLIPKLPKLYRGTHLADPVVRARRGRGARRSSARARRRTGRVAARTDRGPAGCAVGGRACVSGLFDAVRGACARVAEHARFVRIDEPELARWVDANRDLAAPAGG